MLGGVAEPNLSSGLKQQVYIAHKVNRAIESIDATRHNDSTSVMLFAVRHRFIKCRLAVRYRIAFGTEPGNVYCKLWNHRQFDLMLYRINDCGREVKCLSLQIAAAQQDKEREYYSFHKNLMGVYIVISYFVLYRVNPIVPGTQVTQTNVEIPFLI